MTPALAEIIRILSKLAVEDFLVSDEIEKTTLKTNQDSGKNEKGDKIYRTTAT